VFQRRFQALHSAIGRAVLNEQFGIKQRGLGLTDGFFGIVAHQVTLEAYRFYHSHFLVCADLSALW
jgi:hypothetical protein